MLDTGETSPYELQNRFSHRYAKKRETMINTGRNLRKNKRGIRPCSPKKDHVEKSGKGQRLHRRVVFCGGKRTTEGNQISAIIHTQERSKDEALKGTGPEGMKRHKKGGATKGGGLPREEKRATIKKGRISHAVIVGGGHKGV